MTVNGIELKEGQVWTTTSFGNVTLSKEGVSHEYPWLCIFDEGDFSITEDGKYWNDDKEPILLELIEETVITNKFNPQPGDKIICNNDEEFICCTLEFLNAEGLANHLSNEYIFAYREAEDKTYFKYSWQYWNKDGAAREIGYDIREVIPAESKEVMKEDEPRYTVEEVTEAFANALHLSWVGGRQKGINKVKDYLSKKHNPEYHEYLRLKAIYE